MGGNLQAHEMRNPAMTLYSNSVSKTPAMHPMRSWNAGQATGGRSRDSTFMSAS